MIRRIGDRFRVIIAQPTIMDALLREGIHEHLDGLYSVAPAWTMSLVRAAEAGDWDRAAAYQRRLNQLLDLMRQLDAEARDKLLAEPIIQELIRILI